MTKRTTTLAVLAALATVSLAQGENKPNTPPTPTRIPVNDADYDLSGKALLTNPALVKEIDDTLIRGASCRTMAALGYGNGYQCPPAGMAACMKMLTDGKVDACARLNNRDYPHGCGTTEGTDPAARASSTCADLSQDLWATLAVKVPFATAKKRVEAFGCVADTATSFVCPAHIYEWLCQPFERGKVLTCKKAPPPAGPSIPK
jgi:hypothetical protein